jgi:hypothetical protein
MPRRAIAPHAKLALSSPTLAGTSLHALAGRHQRGRDASNEAIVADLAVFANARSIGRIEL